MKLAIMQPYFAPYIGYFQLMKSVETFVIYDNVQYTKKGWINRNRYLLNGTDEVFTIPIKKDSDFLNIRDRKLSSDFKEINLKILRKIESAYRKAPYYNEAITTIRKCFNYDQHSNLFEFILNSIYVFKDYLNIDVKILVSSELDNENSTLRGQQKVIHICKILNASNYINPMGGKELYNKEEFKENGITLNFLKSKEINYGQFKNEFVPWLSIIDIMMFNSPDQINDLLDHFVLE
jgi:hypothetical protein